MIPGDLKIITLECPYDNWKDPLTRALFNQVVTLKLRGYQGVYPYGVLPVDTTDFVATHHLVAKEETGGEFRLLMGFKTMTWDRCQIHRLPFPALSILRSSEGTEPHQRAVQEIIDRCSRHNISLSYGSSWTIVPEIRQQPELAGFLKDLTKAMLVLSQAEEGIREEVCCGIPRVKTDMYFQSLGYQRLKISGEILPPFLQSSLIGEIVAMYHRTEFSFDARKSARQHQAIWNARIVVGQDKSTRSVQKAA